LVRRSFLRFTGSVMGAGKEEITPSKSLDVTEYIPFF
jgi:hypothetical protein